MFKLYLLLSLSCVMGVNALSERTLLQNRLEGAVVGSAIGDALGRATHYFDTTTELKNTYGEEGLSSFNGFKKTDWKKDAQGIEAALYSANTVLAREALLALQTARKSGANAAQAADEAALSLVKQFETEKLTKDALFDHRNHTLANLIAAEQLAEVADKQTVGWSSSKAQDKHYVDEIDQESDSSALARVWPVGLVYADDLSKAKNFAEKLTLVTHRHPAARAASAAIVAGIAAAVRGVSVDDIINEMVKAAEQFDKAEKLYKPEASKMRAPKKFSSKAVRDNRDLIAHNKMLTSDMIRYAATAARSEIEPEVLFGATNKKQDNHRSFRGYLLGNEADEAVAAAAYFLVKNPVSVHSAVAQAANIPGKGALVASLAGALVGARMGYDSLNDSSSYELKWLENRAGLVSVAQDVHPLLKDFVVQELPQSELQATVRAGSWFSTLGKAAATVGLVVIGYKVYEWYTTQAEA